MPPVTRLARCASPVSQGTASRAPGYAVPNLADVAASTAEDATSVSVARGARSCVACRRALPSVRATQQPPGVNGLSAIQHNRALFEVPPVVRCALLVSSPLRFACALRVRITSGYVLRPYRLPHARCCHACSKDSRCARAKKLRQHIRLVTRSAPVCTSRAPAHPGQSAGAGSRRCASLLPRPVCLAAIRPRALRARGLPGSACRSGSAGG